jgi:hypothetical protein
MRPVTAVFRPSSLPTEKLLLPVLLPVSLPVLPALVFYHDGQRIADVAGAAVLEQRPVAGGLEDRAVGRRRDGFGRQGPRAGRALHDGVRHGIAGAQQQRRQGGPGENGNDVIHERAAARQSWVSFCSIWSDVVMALLLIS